MNNTHYTLFGVFTFTYTNTNTNNLFLLFLTVTILISTLLMQYNNTCNTYSCFHHVLGRCWTSRASRGRWPPRACCKYYDLWFPAVCLLYFVVEGKPPFPPVVLSSSLKQQSCWMNSCWLWTCYSSGCSRCTRSTWGAWRVRPEGKNLILK